MYGLKPVPFNNQKRKQFLDRFLGRERRDFLVVLDGWEGVVKMVEQSAPLLVPVGLAEANGVVFERLP